jgi:hypothetical protein
MAMRLAMATSFIKSLVSIPASCERVTFRASVTHILDYSVVTPADFLVICSIQDFKEGNFMDRREFIKFAGERGIFLII